MEYSVKTPKTQPRKLGSIAESVFLIWRKSVKKSVSRRTSTMWSWKKLSTSPKTTTTSPPFSLVAPTLTNWSPDRKICSRTLCMVRSASYRLTYWSMFLTTFWWAILPNLSMGFNVTISTLIWLWCWPTMPSLSRVTMYWKLHLRRNQS